MTVITGAIKFVDVPNDFCITNVTDLIKFIEKNGKIEFDASQVTNVVVSVDQPTDTTVIWYKLSPSGNFIGIFVYIQSAWQQLFPVPNAVYRVYGNSTDLDPGFALITTSTPGFTAEMVTFLQTQWYQGPSDSFYSIFDVVYVGL